ncbi:MAG: hypothetical protein ABH834_02555 [Candidatus Altiarchaeota archaeon]
MVEPKKRTRSVKRVSKRTPKGRTVIRFKKEKLARPKCGRCGSKVPDKNKKIYGRNLCSRCTEDLLRYTVQWKAKTLADEVKDVELRRDLTIEKYLPAGWFADLAKGAATPRKKKKVLKRKPKKEAKPAEKPKAKPKKEAKPAEKPKAKPKAAAKKKATKKTKK